MSVGGSVAVGGTGGTVIVGAAVGCGGIVGCGIGVIVAVGMKICGTVGYRNNCVAVGRSWSLRGVGEAKVNGVTVGEAVRPPSVGGGVLVERAALDSGAVASRIAPRQ